jgi:hypothetical protein
MDMYKCAEKKFEINNKSHLKLHQQKQQRHPLVDTNKGAADIHKHIQTVEDTSVQGVLCFYNMENTHLI